MRRLTRLELDGYKGVRAAHPLPAAMILSGPNGCGKTAVLGALRLLLGGPLASAGVAGLARLFPARGGKVRVEDEAGAWLERGADVDPDSGSVREILRPSGCPDGSGTARRTALEAEWAASAVLLDLGALLALAPEGRREYLLRLCGSAARMPAADLFAALGDGYARKIGGPGATREALARPEVLPEAVAAKARAWHMAKGPREVADAMLRAGEVDTATALSELAAAFNRERLDAGAAAREADAAATELAKGMAEREQVEAEVAQAEKAEAAARMGLGAAEDRARDAERARRAAITARTETEAAMVTAAATGAMVADAQARLAALPEIPAGSETRPPARTPEADAAMEKAAEAGRVVQEMQATLAEGERLRRQVDNWAREVRSLAETPAGRLAAAIGPVERAVWDASRGSALWPVKEAQELVEAARAILGDHEERAARARKRHEESVAEAAACAGPAPEVLARAKTEAAVAAEAAAAMIRRDVAASQTWEERAGARARAMDERRRAEALMADADRRAEVAKAHRNAVLAAEDKVAAIEALAMASAPADGSLDRLRAALAEASARYAAANRAMGAARALREARSRAVDARARGEAFTAAEGAALELRAALVDGAVAPVLERAAALLRAGGRLEVPVAILETAKGRPTVEFGWRPPDGAPVYLDTLSGGEMVLLAAALAAALAERAPGRRVLLLEADPCDYSNLSALLALLTPAAGWIGNMVVATSRALPAVPAGWVLRQVQEGSPAWQGGGQ